MRPPEKHTFETIWGHEAARRLVPRLLAAGRLPHAILLTGPDAIGKRSLALAMAKAILSAGKPPPESRVDAPAPPAAKRKVPEPPPGEGDKVPENQGGDLFAGEDDLFGGEAEPDLFATPDEVTVPDAKAEEPPPAPEPEPKPKPPPPKAKKTKKSTRPAAAPSKPAKAPAARPPAPRRATFQGYDPRVCRLVEASYPPDADEEGRARKVGHVDLTIVEPSGNRRGILVNQVRYLQDIGSVQPVEGAYRVVLLFGADAVTPEGGNSILKLLEEPPSYLVLILVANQAARVLPTIRSRCAEVPLEPLPEALLAEKLREEEGLEPSLAEVAASLSEGRPGVALAVVQSGLLEKRRRVFEARLDVDRFGLEALPASAARLDKEGAINETLWLLLSLVRDRLVRKLVPDRADLVTHRDTLDLLDAVAADPEMLDAEAERLLEAYRVLLHPFVPNARAALQLALWPED